MEDVRQRLGGMGLSGVTMEQLSDVEWKLGEIKVRVCVRDRLPTKKWCCSIFGCRGWHYFEYFGDFE